MNRRRFIQLMLATGLSSSRFTATGAKAYSASGDSLTAAPIELAGEWGPSYPPAAIKVLARIREVCLANLRLVSDQQPTRIRVDNHPQGSPAIWLHPNEEELAWIIVDIGPHDWCKLAYQFGHELGHVLCNSWQFSAKPGPPSQWVEEAMVEAFSLRGLNLLADSWALNPPFAGDAAFPAAIRQYRQNVIGNYSQAAQNDSAGNLAAWLKEDRGFLEGRKPQPRLTLEVLALLERDIGYVEDLGAVNRWRSRTYVPIEDYLTLWEKSCREVKSPGLLPSALANLFGLN